MTTAQQRGRRTLLLIAACFFLPIALAAYMYFSGNSWRPAESTQMGDLIMPPRLLPDAALATGDEPTRLHGTWTLLVAAGKQCAADCALALDHVKRIRLSLGPKMTRVQTVFLPAAAAAIPAGAAEDHPALFIIPPQASGEIRSVVGNFEEGQIFLVDPLGNLMMEYVPGTEMAAIRKDISHLLNLSGIG